MKGIKTTTSLQVGDLIRVKTGQTVYSFAGETGNTEPDDAIAGDNLGEVTKLVGSSVVFKDSGNRIRNTVSIGGIDFSANPNFDYQLLKEPKTETTFERYVNLGLGIFDRIFGKTSNTSNNNGSDSGTDKGTDNTTDGKDEKDPKNEEKTFLQKYGAYGIGALILGGLAYVVFGGKKQQPRQPYNPPPQFPRQNQPQNQYQSVRL